jgi:hypothetical protein
MSSLSAIVTPVTFPQLQATLLKMEELARAASSPTQLHSHAILALRQLSAIVRQLDASFHEGTPVLSSGLKEVEGLSPLLLPTRQGDP